MYVCMCGCQCGHGCVKKAIWKSEDNFGCQSPPSTLFKTRSVIIYPKYANLAILWMSRGYLSTSYLCQDYRHLLLHLYYKHFTCRTISQALKEHISPYSSSPRPHTLLAMDSVKAQATPFPVAVVAKNMSGCGHALFIHLSTHMLTLSNWLTSSTLS